VALVDFPKVCGAAAVVGVVSMMVRPDAIARDVEDLTAQNIEPEAQNDVELLLANDLEVIGREAVCESFGDRHDGKDRAVREFAAAIHGSQGVVRDRASLGVPLGVETVKKLAAPSFVPQDSPEPDGQGSWLGRWRLLGRVEDHRLDSGEVALLDVIDDRSCPGRQGERVHH